MPVAMALLRDVQNLCPKDVLNFILDLIKYNDNRKNKVKVQIDQILVCNKVINTWYYVKCAFKIHIIFTYKSFCGDMNNNG